MTTIDERFRELWAARPPGDRIRAAIAEADAIRSGLTARMQRERPDADLAAIRRSVAERLYGHDPALRRLLDRADAARRP